MTPTTCTHSAPPPGASESVNISVEELQPEALLRLGGGRNAARMLRLFSIHQRVAGPLWLVLKKPKNSRSQSGTSHADDVGEISRYHSLTIEPRVLSVIACLRQLTLTVAGGLTAFCINQRSRPSSLSMREAVLC
jgi:hypothetical protein